MQALFIALVIGQTPFQPLSGVAGKASGDAHLVAQSDWHNLDINLSFKGSIRLSPEELQLFKPPAGIKLDEQWHVKDDALLPLLRILHSPDWKPAPGDAAQYQRWRGELTNQVNLQGSGVLTMTCTKAAPGYRLEFGGAIRAVELKAHGNRFGPNYQRDLWKHEILGAIVLTEDGVPVGLEIRDSFKVEGRFYNAAAGPTDDNRREGTLLVSMPIAEPLSVEKITAIKSLISKLGDETFAVRERVMEELLSKGASITPHLRQLGLAHADPEVRRRCQWLLDRLLDE